MPLAFPPHHFGQRHTGSIIAKTHSRIDVIHVKTLLLDVPHYTNIIERLAVTLRPGGLMVLVEVEPRYVSAHGPILLLVVCLCFNLEYR